MPLLHAILTAESKPTKFSHGVLTSKGFKILNKPKDATTMIIFDNTHRSLQIVFSHMPTTRFQTSMDI